MKIADRIMFYPGIEGFDIITSNTYLICDDILTVVDPGHIGQLKTLLQHLRQDEIRVEDIKLIVNTHSHFDHCSANLPLQRTSKAKIAIHRLEEEYLERSQEIARRFGDNLHSFKADQYLQEGEELTTGAFTFQIIHTPGHTPGSICLYEPNLKLLISGDTIFPHGNIGRVDLPGGNPAQLVKSVKRLSKLDVTILAPGHMEVAMEGVNEQIKASLRSAESLL